MDSASLRSLTPLLDGIDRWVELAPLLPVIVSLELVLSADKTSSKDIIIGNRGANSTHLSIPSSKGVNDLRDAESIKLRIKSYFTTCLVYVNANNSI